VKDGAALVTGLTDLGHLELNFRPHLQTSAHRQAPQFDPLGGDILGEVAGADGQPLGLDAGDALCGKQADLAMPLAGVGVPFKPVPGP
jgi:hypothetical protein